MNTLIEKSEILFLYETKYSIPNGDPFTGEQRYDEESKRVLVSDVRIKRFIRDYLLELGREIFVINDKSQIISDAESGAASRLNALIEKYKDDPSIKGSQSLKLQDQAEISSETESTQAGTKKKGKGKGKNDTDLDALKLLQKCIDVRLFGGISTKEGMAVNLTGPVQFALLNPALNQSDLRIHQNTSVFSSSAEKSRGSIGTTSVVPFSICQIHGWINPFTAKYSKLTQSDIDEMFAALWYSINNANTRTKCNQSSVLLLQIVYNNITDKLYEVDKFIKMSTQNEGGAEIAEKRDEQIRDRRDFKLNIEELVKAADSKKVKVINYYTEDQEIKNLFPKNEKFKELTLASLTPKIDSDESSSN